MKCASDNNSFTWLCQNYGIKQLPSIEDYVVFTSVKAENWCMFYCYYYHNEQRYFSVVTVKVYDMMKTCDYCVNQ